MKEKEKTKKLTDEGPQSCPETTGQQCSSTSNLYSPKLMPPQTQFPSLTHGYIPILILSSKHVL